MNDKILITGATGHFGKGTIEFLLKKGVVASQISALVRDEKKAAGLKEKGINIIIGNYEDYASLVSAFQGMNKLLFVSGSDVASRIPQHDNVVKAAKEAGVKHVVYTSALSNKSIEKSAIAFVAEAHIKTEVWLAESGLTYTVLKNNLYLDVIPQFIGEKIVETGTIYLPGGNGKAAYTLRADMAEAAANVLTTDGHDGKSYNITNLEAYTYQHVADVISEITGKTISYVSPTPEEFGKTLTQAGVPEGLIGVLTGFALAQAQNEFDVTGNDLEKLLGRKPTNLKEYLRTVYANN